MQTVREQEGLTYGIYARTEAVRTTETGYWRIMSFFAPEKTTQGITSTLRELSKLYEHGIADAELTAFKTIFATQTALQHDSIISELKTLHAYHVHGFTPEEVAARQAATQALTTEAVNEAIRRYLDPATVGCSAAGPTKAVHTAIESVFAKMRQ
jgi:predicted Zn-dependent peptidase